MDNITHSLVGWTIARTGLVRTSPYTTAALVIGANLPDYDIVYGMSGGLLSYLHTHRAESHSFLGLIVQAIILTSVLYGINFILRKKIKNHSAIQPMSCLIAAILGLLSHVLMDFTNSYGVRLLLPFSERWLYGDFIFIVDPWILLILSGAIFLGNSRKMKNTVAWGIAAGFISIILLITPYASVVVKGVWIMIIGGLIAARTSIKTIMPQRIALSAIILLFGYYATMFGIKQKAEQILASDSSAGEVFEQSVAPTFGNIFSWHAFRENDTNISIGYIDNVFSSSEVNWFKKYPKNFSNETARAALGTCTGRTLLRFSRYPVAMIKPTPNGHLVNIFDARFAITPPGRAWASGKVLVKEDLSTQEQAGCP